MIKPSHLFAILSSVLILSLFSCEVKKEVEVDVDLSDAFVHSAYFWFKEEASQAQIDAFIADSEQLRQIEEIRGFFAGKPANTNRDVIENTYDYAFVFLFEDLAAQEVYQAHPLHKALIEKHAEIWQRVMVTDVDR